MLWFWTLAAAASLLALHSLLNDRGASAFLSAALRRRDEPRRWPPATVIVPVKGEDEGLAAHLEALATLDYPDYELIVAAQQLSDIPPGCLPAGARVVLAPPGDPHTGEKIRNLLAAVAAARPQSEVFAFADSDGLVSPGWLKALVAPLSHNGVAAATSYRWYTPSRVTFPTLLRSLWNGVIAGLFVREHAPFAWGGATAITRRTFYQLDIPGAWQGHVSDDLRLTFAVRRAKLHIAYAPLALVASTDSIALLPLLAWIKRQLILSRVFHPRLFYPAFAATSIYCASMAACLIVLAHGHAVGAAALAFQLGAGAWKAVRRTRAAAALLPAQREFFRRWSFAYWALLPLATWLWLVGFLLACTTSTINWRGNRYHLSPVGCRKL